MKILKGSTWENLCPRNTFRARLSAVGNIFNRWKYTSLYADAY